MFLRINKSRGHDYLVLAKSVRIDGKPRQEYVATLGRLDDLRESGQIDKLSNSFAKFSKGIAVVSENSESDIENVTTEIIGPAYVIRNIFNSLRLQEIINNLSLDTRYTFNIFEIIFINTMQRLMSPGSDRSIIEFIKDNYFDYKEDFKLQYSYRVMDWLGKPLDEAMEQEPDTTGTIWPSSGSAESARPGGVGSPLGEEAMPKRGEPKVAKSTRTVTDVIEERLFKMRHDVLTQARPYFFDTTSFYFEGMGGQELGRRGHSKDHRGDLKQVVMGAVLDDQGYPICTELWPGNTADVTTMVPIAQRLKDRFGIENMCLVADRGMISKNTIKALTEIHWSYILGVKMRNCVDSPLIFKDDSPYIEITKERIKSSDPAPLKVKTVSINNTTYIVCLNTEEARKDSHDRENIVESLKKALSKGDKSLIRNEGYRKFLISTKNKFEINQSKIEEDAKFDGIFILTTNLDLPAEQIAIKYKQLLNVESLFRNFKSIVDTRPIYHKKDNNIRGHIWISFLALLVKQILTTKVNKIISPDEPPLEWENIKRSLNRLMYITIDTKPTPFKILSNLTDEASKVFKSLGITRPSRVVMLPKAIDLEKNKYLFD
jgi:hypothetical protein